MRSIRSSTSGLLALLLVGSAVSACGSRQATMQAEPATGGAEAATLPTEADYHGTYDLYMGQAPIVEGEPAPMTAEWTSREFIVYQGGNPTIRTEIAIDTEKGEIRIWDETAGDVRCASEGVYSYDDDGEVITLNVVSDPCTNRAEAADGSRLVRR